jgi:hypothetical protein
MSKLGRIDIGKEWMGGSHVVFHGLIPGGSRVVFQVPTRGRRKSDIHPSITIRMWQRWWSLEPRGRSRSSQLATNVAKLAVDTSEVTVDTSYVTTQCRHHDLE